MNAPRRFTQTDLKRAMKAAKQSGYPAARIIIDPNGRMEIVVGRHIEMDEEDDFKLV